MNNGINLIELFSLISINKFVNVANSKPIFDSIPFGSVKNPSLYRNFYSIPRKLTHLEYKLCIIDKDSAIIRWENLKQNRSLSLKTSCSIFFTSSEPEVEYDFDGSDATSTQLNSTRKTDLSEI